MKKILLSIIAALTAVSLSYAHCGTCGVGGEAAHGEGHATSCSEETLAGYFGIQKGLANDDLAAARKSAKALRDDKAESKCVADGKECCVSVAKETAAIAEADDLAKARVAFHALSDGLIHHLEGHASNVKSYKMYCPMAFDNKGAAWLQDSDDVQNPYFGAEMYKCGVSHGALGES